MKLFTKLALVSAVAISSNAMAMQAMDDAALSATTGQDGISIGIGISKIDIAKVHVFDGDGLAAAGAAGAPGFGGTAAAGAITLNNVVLAGPHKADGTLDTARMLATGNLADVTIDTDAGAGGTKPFLNVAAAVSGLDISLGKIEVNNATGSAGAYVAGTSSAEILGGLSLKTGKMNAVVQLGNTPQGAMIKLAGSMVGGLEIKDLALKDASTAGGGYITLGSIKLSDTGSATGDLALDADVAVTQKGLAITAMKNAAGTDIYITKIVLGGGTPPATGATPFNGTGAGSASIGDVAISGMKVFNGAAGTTPGAVITISGH
ncbi:DUF6160 family protein [Acinetobacter sp. P8-3-8]|uniref:putative pilus system protein FilA n=1 Tax=Acinetobacter sp. P8-3-8 TaxID=1029823 RepID=UPI00024871B3|nr:DUF6160 family protein [Acinetobacter sp. P8-3-8]